MQILKIILWATVTISLGACSLLLPSKKQTKTGADLPVEKIIVEAVQSDNPALTTALTEEDKKEEVTTLPAEPSIVATQSAQLAAGLSNTPTASPSNTPALRSQPQQTALPISQATPVKTPSITGSSITLNRPYQQVWADAKKVLPRAGYPIMEQDNTSGTYYILDKVGSGGIIKRDTPIYQLHLQNTGSGTLVTLTNAQNQPVAPQVAERILSVLR